MSNNTDTFRKTYTIEKVEPHLKNASWCLLDDAMVIDSPFSDDPSDYNDEEEYNFAKECFLFFPQHENEWEEVDDVWFPRNRNQEVVVEHGSIYYLYDSFGVEHKVIPYYSIHIDDSELIQ